MTRYYIMMVYMQATAENPMTCDYEDIPLSGMIHTKRFAAFLEMQHAKDDPRYAGEQLYILDVTECVSCKHFQNGNCTEDISICDDFTCSKYTRR